MNNDKKNFGVFRIPSILVLSLFILTYFIYKDFNIRMMLGYGILVVILIPSILTAIKNNGKGTIIFSKFEKYYLFLTVVAFLNIFRGDADINYEILTYVFAMFLSLFYLCLGDVWKKDISKMFNIILIFTCIFIVWELINLFIPNLKYLYLPYLSKASQEYNRHMISKGFFISIGGSLTYVAYIMTFAIGVLLAKFSVEPSRKYLLAIFVCLSITILMGRRGELLATIFSILLFRFLNEKNYKKFLIILGIGIGTVLALKIFLMLIPLLKEYHIFYRYILTFEKAKAGRDISSGRLELYRMAIDIFKKHPYFGIGWRNFGKYVPDEFRKLHGHPEIYGNFDLADVHNIYLQFFCETGFISGGIIIGILGILYYKTIRLMTGLFRKKIVLEELKYKAVTQCTVFSFFIQSFFLMTGFLDPVFSKLIFWFFYALSIKMVSAAYRNMKNTSCK